MTPRLRQNPGQQWVRAGISYALTEAMDEGHCGLPTEELTLMGRVSEAESGRSEN